ncbi:lysosomal alpha-mannosidase-like [Lycorma delicatula]|uniref:lysosomal alpha-mannosidase-like n=1 Tax=Lycorma delicatula TaxID=130591 RepID=UPI003F51152E
MTTSIALILFFLIITTAADEENENIYPTCGYKGCPEISQNKTNIHLICHTHDDVGWVKTVDQYFFGGRRNSKGNERFFAVEQILDSVISELLKNKERRFVYVESAFLWQWWILKDSNVQDTFKRLVDEGRLQLLGGGWVMSDEATPHYSALIDQMTLGHKFMKDTFGECNLPKVAWQIDPFGHSSEVALEFTEMGFDGLFFSRMDRKEFDKRKRGKELEMIWQPDTREGSKGELFTGQTYDPDHPYHPPTSLCFDVTCTDEPVIDNKLLHGYNIERRANDFLEIAQQWASPYKTNNVMLTMGGDFHYMVASSWFNNLDRLMKYINKNRTDVNVIYSTPACYLKAVHQSKENWPVKKNEDFFPYGGSYSEIWTGYYTSRPTLKYLIYRANNFFQACKQLRIPLKGLFEDEQNVMARAMAIAQHHDAVSGTEKGFVAEDYKQYIMEGTAACQKIYNATLSQWNEEKLNYEFCPKLNVTECATTEKNPNFIITLYNPQAHYKNHTVIVPVELDSYKITDLEGLELSYDLLPLPAEVKAILGRLNYASHPHELIFQAMNLPPLGIKSFLVEKIKPESDGTKKKNIASVTEFKIGDDKDNFIIGNGELKLKFDGRTGFITTVIRKKEEWQLKQNFYQYTTGYSGAYLFSPLGEALPVVNKVDSITAVNGTAVIEVRQKFTPYLSQIIRLFNNKDQIEFQWLVGPLPKPMQLITRFSTALVSGKFYTDSNGRRLLQRKRHDSIEKSYYPITSAAVLQDNTHRVTILTDRPQGAANIRDGEIEIMLHRQLDRDDDKGVEEILNETEFREPLVVRGNLIVQLSTSELATKNPVFADGAKRHRILAQDIAMSPIVTFSPALNITSVNFKDRVRYSKNAGLIQKPLPQNIHLLTFEQWSNSTALVRLEHIFETGEEPVLSQPVTINLKELFSNYEVTSAVELSLSATIEKTKIKRLRWKREDQLQDEVKVEPLPASLEVTLQPMQIRTFEIKLFKSSQSRSGSHRLSFSTLILYLLVVINVLILMFGW